MKTPFLFLLTFGISLATLTPATLANPSEVPNLANPAREGRAIAAQPIRWTNTAATLRGQSDRNFTFLCPPKGDLYTVWGTDIYTDDSSICSAAAHAGLITLDGGTVTIGIRPGQNSYQGSLRNNVKSLNYRKWRGSFVFVR